MSRNEGIALLELLAEHFPDSKDLMETPCLFFPHSKYQLLESDTRVEGQLFPLSKVVLEDRSKAFDQDIQQLGRQVFTQPVVKNVSDIARQPIRVFKR